MLCVMTSEKFCFIENATNFRQSKIGLTNRLKSYGPFWEIQSPSLIHSVLHVHAMIKLKNPLITLHNFTSTGWCKKVFHSQEFFLVLGKRLDRVLYSNMTKCIKPSSRRFTQTAHLLVNPKHKLYKENIAPNIGSNFISALSMVTFQFYNPCQISNHFIYFLEYRKNASHWVKYNSFISFTNVKLSREHHQKCLH